MTAYVSSRRFYLRTAIPLFAVGAVLLAAGIYGAWRVHRLHKRGSAIVSDNVASIRAAEELETTLRELRHRLKRYLSSSNERHLVQVEELLPPASASIAKTSNLASGGRQRQVIARLQQAHRDFRGEFARVRNQGASDDRRDTFRMLADELIPDRMLANTDRYIALNERELDLSNQRNQSTANRLMFGLLLLGTCGGVAGLIAGYGIARLVNRRIVQLAVPIRDAAGKLSQVAGPVTVAADPGFDDLESILKSLSEQVATIVSRLQESQRERQRAEQLAALGQLAAGLAHELRNPLTSMKAILQLAAEPDDLSQRDVEILREEIERLERSVQSLLDYARPSRPRRVLTGLNALLDDTAHLAERHAARQGNQLDFAPLPADIRLLADAGQLRQVALNLVLNAVDATPRGGVVRLECAWEERACPEAVAQLDRLPRAEGGAVTGWAVIRVSDTGAGLPPALGDGIFEPFVTTKDTGTGLGLSICKQIVLAHGGAIRARNRAGQGAVFEAWLPVEPASPSLSETCAPAGGSEPLGPPQAALTREK